LTLQVYDVVLSNYDLIIPKRDKKDKNFYKTQ